MLNYVRPVLKSMLCRSLLSHVLKKRLWGQMRSFERKYLPMFGVKQRNARGEIKTARIQTENAYSLTVNGSLAVVNYLLKNTVKGGTYTPANLIGL